MSVETILIGLITFGTTLLKFSLPKGNTEIIEQKTIGYQITSRLNTNGRVHLVRQEGTGRPIIVGSSMAEIQKWLKEHNMDELPGELPCQGDTCIQCGVGCIKH